MGWRPQPRFDKSIKAWICRYKGKKTYLGRDYAEACKRFAVIVGPEFAGTIKTIGKAAQTWQTANGDTWTKYLLGRWIEFAGTVSLTDITDEHFRRYATWLQKRYAPETTRKMLRYAVPPGYRRQQPVLAVETLGSDKDRRLIRADLKQASVAIAGKIGIDARPICATINAAEQQRLLGADFEAVDQNHLRPRLDDQVLEEDVCLAQTRARPAAAAVGTFE